MRPAIRSGPRTASYPSAGCLCHRMGGSMALSGEFRLAEIGVSRPVIEVVASRAQSDPDCAAGVQTGRRTTARKTAQESQNPGCRPRPQPVEPVIPLVHAPDDPGLDSGLDRDPVPESSTSSSERCMAAPAAVVPLGARRANKAVLLAKRGLRRYQLRGFSRRSSAVEHPLRKRVVGGSNPSAGTSFDRPIRPTQPVASRAQAPDRRLSFNCLI